MANSPARSTVDVGSVIAETFTIEALIGRGGMGSVFLASHNRLPGKFVAIKLLHTELNDQEVLSRFKREAHIASQLNHPNIVTVHDHNVTEDGTPYLVLEHLQGVSLAQRLRDQGSLPLEQVFSIVRQVGSALAAAHRGGIVHRDLKPANIFLVPTEVDGRGVEIAKVLDFGISKIRGSQTVKTQESTLLGTPQYMAPEQAKGAHSAVDERTDIFAFGAIVYEMLAGHPAFAGETIPEVVFKVVYEPPLALAKQAPSVPLAIVAAVEQAMAKRPDDRFANVSAFVEAMTGTPVSQFRTPALPPLSDGLDTAAPSRGRSTGQDAFAQTMNSLDVDVPDAKSATVVSNAAIVLPQDIQTVATAPPAPPRSSLKLVLVGVAAAAIAVTVMYLVMRTPGGGAATIDAGAPMAAIAPDAAVRDAGVDAVPIDAAIVAAAPRDAGVDAVPIDAAIVAAAPRDAAVAATHDAGPAVVATTAADDANADEATGQTLARAEAALRSAGYDEAERLANAVINGSGSARQHARGYAVHGTVQCAHSNNEERALLDLRAIPVRFRPLRAALLAVCHEHGFLASFR